MVREIMRDPMFLSRKSEEAVRADKYIALDLLDTLHAHEEGCVGMAANMIGESKRIIAVQTAYGPVAMINPVITKKAGPYDAEEGCLSLSGVRKTKRYETIEVRYLDLMFKPVKKAFTGYTAQIIQHEVDHCDGILI